MKRILVLSVLAILIASVSYGQMAYKKGDQAASAMFGLGFSHSLSGTATTVPPLSAAFDYGYNENISIGGIIGYESEKYESSSFGYGYKFTYSYLIIAARGAYHVDLLHNANIDTYGGVLLGYDVASSSAEYTGNWAGLLGIQPSAESVGGAVFGVFAGGRYYFNRNLAVQLEVGYGLSYLNIGIAYKL
jgi:hypothetical protein